MYYISCTKLCASLLCKMYIQIIYEFSTEGRKAILVSDVI